MCLIKVMNIPHEESSIQESLLHRFLVNNAGLQLENSTVVWNQLWVKNTQNLQVQEDQVDKSQQMEQVKKFFKLLLEIKGLYKQI